MSIIDRFAQETPNGKSPWMNQHILSHIFFVSIDQITKMEICYMVTSEHSELIEVIQQLIATRVLDPEEAAEDGSIDDYFSTQDEQYDSGLREAVVSTGETEVVTKEVEDVHQDVDF